MFVCATVGTFVSVILGVGMLQIVHQALIPIRATGDHHNLHHTNNDLPTIGSSSNDRVGLLVATTIGNNVLKEIRLSNGDAPYV